MDIIVNGRLTLDGKRYEDGKKIAVDDETGADLIRIGKAKPKEEPKAKAEAAKADPAADAIAQPTSTPTPASKTKPA